MKKYQVAVIGGGHAGCEAALACARMGHRTVMFAINLDSIAFMPCNPSIGGTSKGHLVREIDALGGEMGKNIDRTYIQSRMLNTAKGPAVYSLRAQADKHRYSLEMKKCLENTENLEIIQAEIKEITTACGVVTGVVDEFGQVYTASAVVLATGTYLQSRCLYGETIIHSGPNGLRNSVCLSDCLKNLGIRMYRFKTGTPARVDKRSLDFTKMQIQHGDSKVVPFSFETKEDDIRREQIPCYLTYTNVRTHDIINKNIHRSPMYSGAIEGTGTRYCPSIEDKVVRFADKDRHQVFIEPEGENTNEMYVQGMSTSLPLDVQEEMYQTLPGMENCRVMRGGYAIEYDCIDATQLDLSLEFKEIKGLYSAGQFNGSSGYEEAAAQGLIAGINAALMLQEREPLIIDRSEGYIGVLIDDLVTKGSSEPYRMMTSRAEYRLLLRQDNADIRLTKLGYQTGLISEERYQRHLLKLEQIAKELRRVKQTTFPPSEAINALLLQHNSTEITTGAGFADLIRRPELNYHILEAVDTERPPLPDDVTEQVNIQIKYEGYIKRQAEQVEGFKKLETKLIPHELDYNSLSGLRLEARQKLSSIRPRSVGHASRIAGVSPADISVLLVHLQRV